MSQLRSELKQSRPFRSLAEEVLLNLLRTASHLEAAQTRLLRPRGLTHSQYNVLRILRGAGEQGLPCQEVGARMVTRVPDVTRLLDRLERSGLVQRQRSATDRRVVVARIQPRGLDLLAALDQPVTAQAPQLLRDLGAAELRTLNELLVRARRVAEGELGGSRATGPTSGATTGPTTGPTTDAGTDDATGDAGPPHPSQGRDRSAR